MNDHELTVVRSAFERSLINGAPGISETMRNAIIVSALLHIRYELLPAKLPEDAK